MELTLKHYNNVFFQQYLVLYCMYASKAKTFFSMSIKREPDSNYYYYSDTKVIETALDTIMAKVKAFNDDSTHSNIHKMVVFINETALPFVPESEYLEYIIYDDLLPNFSKLVPALDKSVARYMLDIASQQLEFYVDKIGLNHFPRGDYATKSGLARRYLAAVYPDIVNKNLAYKVRKNHPKYNIVYNFLRYLKPYGANAIMSRKSPKEIIRNCIKLDINSSFWVVPMIHETGAYYKHLPDYCKIDLDKKEGYIAIIKFTETGYKKIQKPKGNLPHWLLMYKYDDIVGTSLSDEMVIVKPTWEDLKITYGITKDDVKILKAIDVFTTPFLPEQRELYKRLHHDKAVAKNKKDELTVQTIKTTGHCLHGYPLGNWFTEVDGSEWYANLWGYHPKEDPAAYRPYDMILNTYDAVMMYEYARYHILRIINLFDTVYYYDTDCVVVPDTEENREKIEEYNEWIKSLYAQNKLNYLDYTHDGHTIGFLELEAEYDAFYFTTGKEYFYVKKDDDKMYSTTAGYPKNIVAKHIEDDSGLTGLDALEWLVQHPEYETPMYFIQNGTGISFTTFKHHKYEKGLY